MAIVINLDGVDVQIGIHPENKSRQITFIDPQSGIIVRCRMPEEAARMVAAKLNGGSELVIAKPTLKGMPQL